MASLIKLLEIPNYEKSVSKTGLVIAAFMPVNVKLSATVLENMLSVELRPM